MAFNRTKLFERLFSWTMHETLKKEKKKSSCTVPENNYYKAGRQNCLGYINEQK